MLSLLGFACRDDELEVRNILMSNPACDINGRGAMGYACLHHACEYGADRIVSLLLAHPDINVNQKYREGTTPFMVAYSNGMTSCVRLLLQDPRVNLSEPDEKGLTPIRVAADKNFYDIIRWWIASGRELDLGEPGRGSLTYELERFAEDPEQTRKKMRAQLRVTGEIPP